MNPRLKQVLLITGFVAIVLAMAFGLYWFFFRGAAPIGQPSPTTPGVPGQLPLSGEALPPGTEAPTTTTGLPPTQGIPRNLELPTGIPEQGRGQVLVAGTVTNLSMSAQGARAYNPADGRFYRITPDGTATPLSGQSFFNVDSVNWAHNSDKAIINYPDGSNILFDFTTNKQVTLPAHWEDFSFSPNDNQIAAKSIGNNESNRYLVVANPDGTNPQPVEELGNNQDKVHVSWSPNNQVIAYSFTGEPLGFDRQSVLLLGKNQENFKALVVEGRGLIPNWSPDGSQLLYSVYNSGVGYRPSLWISGAVGDQINANRRNLHIQTFADKCAWQSTAVVICGVPTSLGEGAALQRSLFNTVPDDIFKINVETGTVVNLGAAPGSTSVSTMTVTGDGQTAIYTDTATGKLIRFDL